MADTNCESGDRKIKLHPYLKAWLTTIQLAHECGYEPPAEIWYNDQKGWLELNGVVFEGELLEEVLENCPVVRQYFCNQYFDQGYEYTYSADDAPVMMVEPGYPKIIPNPMAETSKDGCPQQAEAPTTKP